MVHFSPPTIPPFFSLALGAECRRVFSTTLPCGESSSVPGRRRSFFFFSLYRSMLRQHFSPLARRPFFFPITADALSPFSRREVAHTPLYFPFPTRAFPSSERPRRARPFREILSSAVRPGTVFFLSCRTGAPTFPRTFFTNIEEGSSFFPFDTTLLLRPLDQACPLSPFRADKTL